MTVYLSNHRLWAAFGILTTFDLVTLVLDEFVLTVPLLVALLGLVWQPTLLAILAVVTQRYWLSTWAIVALLGVALWALKSKILGIYSSAGGIGPWEPGLLDLAYLLCLVFANVVVAITILRWRGWNIAFVNDYDRPSARTWQFSILDLGGAATVIAVGAAALRVVRLPFVNLAELAAFPAGGGLYQWLLLLLITGSVIMVSMPWLWLSLGWQSSSRDWAVVTSVWATVWMLILGCLGCAVFGLTLVLVTLQVPVFVAMWKFHYDECSQRLVNGYGDYRRNNLIASRKATTNDSTSERVL